VIFFDVRWSCLNTTSGLAFKPEPLFNGRSMHLKKQEKLLNNAEPNRR